MDDKLLIQMVNGDTSLRELAKVFNVSTQTIRTRMLKIDAQFPNIFDGRKMKDAQNIFSKEDYAVVDKIQKSGGSIKEIETTLQLSPAKASLISTLSKIKKGKIKVVSKEVEDFIKSGGFNTFTKKEPKIRNLPDGVTPLKVFEMTRLNKKMPREEIAKHFNISVGIYRKLYKKGLLQAFPNNKGILAPFDIPSFVADMSKKYTWNVMASRYNISVMNACQWGKKLKEKCPELFE